MKSSTTYSSRCCTSTTSTTDLSTPELSHHLAALREVKTGGKPVQLAASLRAFISDSESWLLTTARGSEGVRAVMIKDPARRYLGRFQVAGCLRHVDLHDHPAGKVGWQCGESADKINITTVRFGPYLVGTGSSRCSRHRRPLPPQPDQAVRL
jgi:hypothetical protein